MKYVLIALALAALCVPAFAQDGDNTTVKAFIHITPDAAPVVPTNNLTVTNVLMSPTAYTSHRAYLGLTDLSTGFTVISFRLTNVMTSCPGVFGAASFVNLMPGNLVIGNPFDEIGATIASTNCLTAPFQIVGYASLFYLADTGSCQIDILDHGQYPRWVVDCNTPGKVNYYCVWLNGGFGTAASSGDVECAANTPVEDATWTSIKALYR